MSRYERTFAALHARRETAFIPFAVAGDPDLRTSERVLRTMVDSGADILEIGYPFSDPIADGPVNQRAAARAIAAGLDHERFFGLVRGIRAATDIPIGVLIYANSVLHYGADRFCRDAARAGIDSLLVADMPPEEYGAVAAAMRAAGLARVFIVSELTPAARMAAICDQVDAFVYVVSRLGPTGVRRHMSTTVGATLQRLRRVTDRPLCVGFGLSKPEHVAAVKRAGADGAIVGSALVAQVEALRNRPAALLHRIERMVSGFKAATR
jgi:tryptophan synthase alpha chain